MARQEIHVGDTPTLRCKFRRNGNLADPTNVSLKVRDPAGNVSTYLDNGALTRDSIGQFSRNVAITLSGTWWWEWIATGLGASADDGSFNVGANPF